MTNRENVITHLQIIRTWSKFARENDLQFITEKHLEDIVQWTDDAIVLLKEVGTELKPCPFCGRTDKLKVWKTEQHVDGGVIENWRVSCSAEGDETGCGGSGGARPTKKEAVEAWNTRSERR